MKRALLCVSAYGLLLAAIVGVIYSLSHEWRRPIMVRPVIEVADGDIPSRCSFFGCTHFQWIEMSQEWIAFDHCLWDCYPPPEPAFAGQYDGQVVKEPCIPDNSDPPAGYDDEDIVPWEDP